MIKLHHKYKDQVSRIGDQKWNVVRLVELSKDFEVMNIPLKHLNMSDYYEKLYLRSMAGHVKAVNDADLKYPIILDQENPVPCSYVD